MMRWRRAGVADLDVLVELNRQLQEDEGAQVMARGALETRMRGWLAGGYHAVFFEEAGGFAAYLLYRDSFADTEGDSGVFVQQFLVVRDRRRAGVGRRAFALLRDEVLARGVWIELEALASNPGGQGFWESLGMHAHAVRYRIEGRG